jgi:hypothetical protein
VHIEVSCVAVCKLVCNLLARKQVAAFSDQIIYNRAVETSDESERFSLYSNLVSRSDPVLYIKQRLSRLYGM